MPKKENNRKNYQAHKAWMENKKKYRPIQEWNEYLERWEHIGSDTK